MCVCDSCVCMILWTGVIFVLTDTDCLGSVSSKQSTVLLWKNNTVIVGNGLHENSHLPSINIAAWANLSGFFTTCWEWIIFIMFDACVQMAWRKTKDSSFSFFFFLFFSPERLNERVNIDVDLGRVHSKSLATVKLVFRQCFYILWHGRADCCWVE